MSSDGRLLATGSWHGRDVKIWNAQTGELETTLPTGNARVQFGPAGNKLAVDQGGCFTVWRVSDWKPLLPRTAKSSATVPGPIAFSPDGRMLAILDSPRIVRLLDAETFEELASLQLAGNAFIHSLLFDPQSSRLFAGTTTPGTVHIWKLNRIRERLRGMQLDWTDGPIPPHDAAASKPLNLKLNLTEPTSDSTASPANRGK
jgi:WD40 repeat protein